MNFLKEISDEARGLWALALAFLLGAAGYGLVGDLRGFDERVTNVEARQAVLIEAVVRLQCESSVASGIHPTMISCWDEVFEPGVIPRDFLNRD